MHCGYVVEVKELRKHQNADKLMIATFFGNDTIVNLDVKVGDLGVYFPSDLQLSKEYCERNNLVRKKDADGNEIGGYLDPDKRNIKAIKLRGEKSDGMYMPISSFDYCFEPDVGLHAAFQLQVGDKITTLNGHEICTKYIPKVQGKSRSSDVSRTRKSKVPYSPMFQEHVDTEQLAYNLSAFRVGDEIDLTLKMHGTSQRTALLPVLKGYKRTLFDIILRRQGTPIYDYDYVSGTRRVVLENFNTEGFYGSNAFRKTHHDTFIGKLLKGETVYYEVVGFTHTGAPIMANGNNEKIGKDFVKQYGKETVFSYGCEPEPKPALIRCPDMTEVLPKIPQSDIYVYRMTMTNADGEVIEYTPDFIRYRCEQMNVKYVPLFGKGVIGKDKVTFVTPEGVSEEYIIEEEKTPGDAIMKIAEKYCTGVDPVGKTHTREGVVVRINNRPKIKVLKHKCYEFKMLEGLIKESAQAPDMEESQEVIEVE